MQNLVICTSVADLDAAREIRSYIEANCPSIAVQDDAVFSASNEVLDTISGAMSDISLLLLSPDAIPHWWSRTQWEAVLIEQPREMGTALAFVLVRPCRFPEIFRKQKFFDLSADGRTGLRILRRWLLAQDPLRPDRIEVLPPRPSAPGVQFETLDELERGILEKPGTALDIPREVALAFSHNNAALFEGVIWLDGRGRSRAGVVGDTAHAIGRKLRGTVQRNIADLQQIASERRCLFVFDGLDPELRDCLDFSCRASVIFTADSGERTNGLTLDGTINLFAQWRTATENCLRTLGDAERHFRTLQSSSSPESVTSLKSLGTAMFGLLRQQDRLAEAYEVAVVLSKFAWEEGNASDLHRWEWEKTWIREEWNQPASPRLRLGTTPEPAQLSFNF